jgi:hypothetical protein
METSSLMHYPGICLQRLRESRKSQSGWLVPRPTFEPETFQMQVRIVAA